MTIDEAIRENELQVIDLERKGQWVRVKAIKLGIEALKAYKKSQESRWYPLGYKLPGETEE